MAEIQGKSLAMVVEDEIDVARLIAVALENADFEVEIIQNGEVALQRLKEAVPKLVVLDLMLPRVSGDQILHHIRTDERLLCTRVIVISGHAQFAELTEDEADLVLLKPFNIEQLQGLVKRIRMD